MLKDESCGPMPRDLDEARVAGLIGCRPFVSRPVGPGWLVERIIPRRRPAATPAVQASACSGFPSRGTHTCLQPAWPGGGFLTQQPPGPQTGPRKEQPPP
jgi:hypothetical protein